MTDSITLAGIPIHVVSEEECEAADIVVCMRKGTATPFTDNVESTCSVCGAEIIHRPHVPKTPPKACFECAVEMMEATKQ